MSINKCMFKNTFSSNYIAKVQQVRHHWCRLEKSCPKTTAATYERRPSFSKSQDDPGFSAADWGTPSPSWEPRCSPCEWTPCGSAAPAGAPALKASARARCSAPASTDPGNPSEKRCPSWPGRPRGRCRRSCCYNHPRLSLWRKVRPDHQRVDSVSASQGPAARERDHDSV